MAIKSMDYLVYGLFIAHQHEHVLQDVDHVEIDGGRPNDRVASPRRGFLAHAHYSRHVCEDED